MNENREYKSDVFSMLMENKSYALEVYNALNHSDYKNPEEVEIIRLERGISLSIRNDASFLIDMNMSFYEHQSTYNPNMPLRSMIYYVNALEDWLRRKNLDLFSRKRIQIPTPHFVVFYNGTEKRPEYEEMRLSEAFCHKTDEPGIEVRCRVYNINPDNNRPLKERSAVLEGYTYFVEKVRTYRKGNMGLEEAVDRAIEDCIKNHVLEDFFRNRKDEVKKMTHLDYTWEKREQMIRKEEFEEGMERGIAQGMEQGIEQGVEQGRVQILAEIICSKLKKGKTPEEIADALEEPVENIQKICRIAEQYAPEYPVEEICRAWMNWRWLAEAEKAQILS